MSGCALFLGALGVFVVNRCLHADRVERLRVTREFPRALREANDEAMAENGPAQQRMVKAIRRLPALAEFYEGIS
jgi:hypothetical protein